MARKNRRIPLVTGSRAWCFWGTDLQNANRQFLEWLDPDYFRYVSLVHWERVEEFSDQKLDRPDRLRAAIALRTVHGQAIETLLAFLAAAIQAPHFPVGWMLQYRDSDLLEVVRAIHEDRPLLKRLKPNPLTWESLSDVIHQHVPETVRRERNICAQFAQLWRRLASQFMAEDVKNEYNSLKHGLRVMPGGFSVAFGITTNPGQPAPREKMQSLGGCEFGSSFFAAESIPRAEKHHLTLGHRCRNWRPEALVVDLQLIANSLGNVNSFLRILAGEEPATVRFSWPSETEAFDSHEEFLLPLERLTVSPAIRAEDIRPFSRQDILATYSTSRNEQK